MDGREYPWGDDFDKRYANTGESGVIGTTAICTYPQGISPSGSWDMSGNVWERTNSWYDKDEDSRVVRGGSWINFNRHARCAYRYYDDPDFRNYFIGFRVVVSLAFH